VIFVVRRPARRRVGRKPRAFMIGFVAAIAGPSVLHLATPAPAPVHCPTLTLLAAGVSLRITLRYPAGCRPFDD